MNVFTRVGQRLKGFPEYLVGYVMGFVEVTLGDVAMTSLALGCVGLGFLTTPLIAGTAYLLAFTLLKALNTVANAIGVSGQSLAGAITHHGANNSPEPPS